MAATTLNSVIIITIICAPAMLVKARIVLAVFVHVSAKKN